MDRPLHMLLVDDRPDSVFLLSEFLLKRHHRVEVSSDMREALGANCAGAGTAIRYDLVIANAADARDERDRDAARAAHAQRPDHGRAARPVRRPRRGSYREAEALGCATFLDKPIDLGKVERAARGGRRRRWALVPTSARRRYSPRRNRRSPGSDQFVVKPTTRLPAPPSSPHAAQRPGGAPHHRPRGGRSRRPTEPFFGTARVVPSGRRRHRPHHGPSRPLRRRLGGGSDRSPAGHAAIRSARVSGAARNAGSAPPKRARIRSPPATRPAAPARSVVERHPARRSSLRSTCRSARVRAGGGHAIDARKPAAGDGSTRPAPPATTIRAPARSSAACSAPPAARSSWSRRERRNSPSICVHCGQLNRVQPRPAR